ncbi:hypothetical protein EDC01DRAFT_678486 [Geopyxis carbonaria]|nr:hypothetical protein EDC01DRAFT_678486 [Geopyxis carbonaria]
MACSFANEIGMRCTAECRTAASSLSPLSCGSSFRYVVSSAAAAIGNAARCDGASAAWQSASRCAWSGGSTACCRAYGIGVSAASVAPAGAAEADSGATTGASVGIGVDAASEDADGVTTLPTHRSVAVAGATGFVCTTAGPSFPGFNIIFCGTSSISVPQRTRAASSAASPSCTIICCRRASIYSRV